MNKILKIMFSITLASLLLLPYSNVDASGKTITCEYVVANRSTAGSTYNVGVITYTYNSDTKKLDTKFISLLSHNFKSFNSSVPAGSFSSLTCPDKVYVTTLSDFDKNVAYQHLPNTDLNVTSASSDGTTSPALLNGNPIIRDNSTDSGTSSTEQENCSGSIIDIPVKAANILNTIYIFIKIATPIILIFIGMLDFGKAMVSNNEKEMREKQSKFVKRIIAAIMVFMMFVLIEFVLNVTAGSDADATQNCINLIIKS